MRSLCPSRTHYLGLDSSVSQFDKNVLVQLTLISSSALAILHFCPIIFCPFLFFFLFFLFFFFFFVLNSAVGTRPQCLGIREETLNVFIERFH